MEPPAGVGHPAPTEHERLADIIRRHSTNREDVRRVALAGLDLARARRLLDLGCGSGFMARAMLGRTAPGATIMGIDREQGNRVPFLAAAAVGGCRGSFLCRDDEIRWFYQQGASRLFPDYWADFVAPVAPADRHDMLAAYHRLLTGPDDIARMAAAKAWSTWEGRTATLLPNASVVSHFGDPHVALSLARIECHYFVHQAFLRPSQLLEDARRLAGIPTVIVHGRYDVICPLENAWALHTNVSGSELVIVPDAGHAASEPGIRSVLVEATDRFARTLA